MPQNDGSKDFERIKASLRARLNAIPDALGEAVLESIRDGSPVTGAPGQPVADGDLMGSWKKTRTASIIRIFSTLFYAPWIEEGQRLRHATKFGAIGRAVVTRRTVLTLRSGRGGFHSVKLTRQGIQRLVDLVVLKTVRALRNG